MSTAAPLVCLNRKLAAITTAASESIGVNEYEDLLIDLLQFLRSGHVARSDAARELARLCIEWPEGAAEALEFTMHTLRWPEVRSALEEHREHGTDFRTRRLAAQVLGAYVDAWPEGDIYRTYRPVGP